MQRSPKHELQTLCVFWGQNIILGQCCLVKKRIAANNSRCSLRWGSYPFCRVLTLETLSRDVPLYRLSSFFNPIWPGLFWCLRDPEGGTLCPPKYLWVREIQFFWEKICLGVIYHIQKDSWSWDAQNPPKKFLAFEIFVCQRGVRPDL